ncbi:GNAT family N-acetyltransferase [Shewanella sp. NIFS-20-20]|uniref:GNAT family N-acetyltransferase n=1 Tax=Shewanella sp. NIFS-20-20 TaxID=2853806 RepID=UPI001C477AD1|nr:GNAT family N-acetyltransferase [Shewanella sp. NIFS-20-20]MBV7316529.1 GNAT family N-acetyltransferase [Shewanella sp. NIFS-20-20]
MIIRQASLVDAHLIAPLFDGYRQFYGYPPDPAVALGYIEARLSQQESIIFVAQTQGTLQGFTQLYWSFCSLDATKIVILYDLFVASRARQQGIGRQLMQMACNYAFDHGAGRVDLSTAKDNLAGQHLYESLGFRRSLDDFYGYSRYPE